MTILSDSYGNLISVSHFAVSTGEKSGFYTLRAFGTRTRYTKTEFGTHSESEDASTYIKNLSTDKEQALVAAREYLAKWYPSDKFSGVIDFDLDEIHRISREESARRAEAEAARIAATDFSVFQTGKYCGRSINEVLVEDKRYCEWFAGNWWTSGSDNERTAAILKEILAPEKKAAQEAQEARLNALRDEIGEQTLRQWEIGFAGAFCQSIASTINAGGLPSGRGMQIVLEIIAKQDGRKGSKAFNARLTELEAKFLA